MGIPVAQDLLAVVFPHTTFHLVVKTLESVDVAVSFINIIDTHSFSDRVHLAKIRSPHLSRLGK